MINATKTNSHGGDSVDVYDDLNMEEVNLNSSKSQIEFNKFSPKRNSSGWNI